jgi:aquaporin Z
VDKGKRYGAEFLGTLLLVFFGVGSAIAGRVEGGVVVLALAFGLVLLALVYILGPVSGCHVNPP